MEFFNDKGMKEASRVFSNQRTPQGFAEVPEVRKKGSVPAWEKAVVTGHSFSNFLQSWAQEVKEFGHPKGVRLGLKSGRRGDFPVQTLL